MKRSSEISNLESKKRRKASGSNSISKSEIDTLQNSILASPNNYNDIVKLLDILRNADIKSAVKHDVSAALLKIFGKLSKNGLLRKSTSTGGAAGDQVAFWLNGKYKEFVDILVQNLKSSSEQKQPSTALSISSLSILLKLLSTVEHKYLAPNQNEYHYPSIFYNEIIKALIFSALPPSVIDAVLEEFVKNYLVIFDDLRYYFFVEMASILTTELQQDTGNSNNNSPSRKVISKRVSIVLQEVSVKFPASEDEIDNFFLSKPTLSKNALKHGSPIKLSSHKIAFQKAWIAGLQLPQSIDQYKQVLNILHQRIIPNMQKPHMLMDFLTDCYNSGGSVALLALNGLFVLMQKYNLDYPNFFTKLYALFDGSIMHAKHRSRFFRLVDLFLSSTHLPAAICASFIKKMARLALTAPPAAVVATIPFIYNQLKRHPTCMKMIHNPEGAAAGQHNDPFNPTEIDPLLTNAIDSSLWELETLQSHYHPNVSTLARIMSQPFRKPQYILEDFLDHSYKTLYEAERTRKIKTILPALEFESFDHVFRTDDTEGTTSSYMTGWTLA